VPIRPSDKGRLKRMSGVQKLRRYSDEKWSKEIS
jgi:hypothetical protein